MFNKPFLQIFINASTKKYKEINIILLLKVEYKQLFMYQYFKL